MITLYVREKGQNLRVHEDLCDISELIKDESNLIWLDATDPSREDMQFLAEEFGFHPLAIDDYFTPHHRPKIDEYPGYFFIAMHSISYVPETQEVAAHELDIFVGKNYIVTLHEEKVGVLERVSRVWMSDSKLLENGTGLLLYDILDGLVDSYFPILDDINDRIDEIEDDIFGKGGGEASPESTFRLKRSLVVLRRITGPMRDVFNTLIRRDQPLLSEQSITYLRDIYDHSLRITDMIDTYRDILGGALDAYLGVISNQLNNVMKTLTVVATILISVQVITGIYGMNFKYMPELGWRYGYPVSIGAMVVIALSLLYYFKRIKWL